MNIIFTTQELDVKSKQINKLVITFFVSALFLSAALSPVIFFVIKFFANTLKFKLFRTFVDFGFFNCFDTTFLIVFILAFVCVLRVIEIDDLWFKKFNTPMRDVIFTSFAFGIIICLITGMFLEDECINHGFKSVVSSVIELRTRDPRIIGHLFIALVIAAIEEMIFRGIIFQLLRRNFKTIIAVIISSAIFACFHMGSGKIEIPADDVTIFSGFKCLWYSVVRFGDNFRWLPFANLALSSIILFMLLFLYKNLWIPTILHALAILPSVCDVNMRETIMLPNISQSKVVPQKSVTSLTLQFILFVFLCLLMLEKSKQDKANVTPAQQAK